MELSIVIPCLNEQETLATCVQKAHEGARSAVGIGNYEILVVDNGSTDGSQEIARQEHARLISEPLRGYGAALMAGVRASQGTYIIIGDADDSYDFRHLAPFVDKLRQGFDLVMGNRFQGGIRPGAMPFLHRYFGNPFLSLIGRLFFHSPVGDFHCGLRGFRREAILGLDLVTTGMEFASEMVVKASLQHLRLTEVPTVLYPAGRSRRPHLRTWSDGWRHLRFLLLYSPRWLFLYPGLLSVVGGTLASLMLVIGPVQVGSLRLDIGTLLFTTSLVVLGTQAIIFAVFTKVFGIQSGFLPEDPLFHRLLRYVKLETGLAVGTLIAVTGAVASLSALEYWKIRFFGELSPSISMRMIIPGAALSTLGIQIVLASFFLSIMGLRHK
jgi:hypothetical protein